MLALKGIVGVGVDYVEIVRVGKDRVKSIFRYNAGYKKKGRQLWEPRFDLLRYGRGTHSVPSVFFTFRFMLHGTL